MFPQMKEFAKQMQDFENLFLALHNVNERGCVTPPKRVRDVQEKKGFAKDFSDILRKPAKERASIERVRHF